MNPGTPSGRFPVRAVQLGALAVVLAASTYKLYELDRFFVPKELVLHLTALAALLGAARLFRGVAFRAIDFILAAYLLVSAASAVFATNHWLGVRALAISASGIALFWAARALAAAGRTRALVGGVAAAVVAGAGTSLLQTYGIETDLFSVNRAPGGTLGNRNFVAHMAAFGLPALLFVSLTTTRWYRYLLSALGVAAVVAVTVITRSRAAYLAFGTVLVVFGASLVLVAVLRREGRAWARLAGLALLAVVGTGAAVFLPNQLDWRTDNPYVESLRGVANYREGSGRGRLVQYRQSLRMAADHPLLGVGPGNWSVEYPEYAARRDPSLDRSTGGVTSNPWPSSDWVAFVSERGFIAAGLLAAAFLMIALAAVRQLFGTAEPMAALQSVALLATGLAASVAGVFDAVLLLALPTLLVWVLFGALMPVTLEEQPERRQPARGLAVVMVLLVVLAGAARSGMQLGAMAISSASEQRVWLRTAALIDPGNYRLRLRLARAGGTRESRCDHARAAHALFPHAHAAESLARRCR